MNWKENHPSQNRKWNSKLVVVKNDTGGAGVTTCSRTTFSIIKLSIATLSTAFKTLSIAALSIKTFNTECHLGWVSQLSHYAECLYVECRYADCRGAVGVLHVTFSWFLCWNLPYKVNIVIMKRWQDAHQHIYKERINLSLLLWRFW